MPATILIFAAFACALGLAVCVLLACQAAARGLYGSAIFASLMAISCAFLTDASIGAVAHAYEQAIESAQP